MPRTVIAFSFLDPIIAPIPVLPAAFSSEAIIAYLTNFSPACPMHAILVKLEPDCSFKIREVSIIPFPHKKEASLILVSSSAISKYTGISEAPLITIPS